VPGAIAADGLDLGGFAARVRPEVVQLWYQMALNGRRDLPLAPSPRAGFEMAVLRMLAFRPAAAVPPVPRAPEGGEGLQSGSSTGSASGSAGSTGIAAAEAAAEAAAPAPVAEASVQAAAPKPGPLPDTTPVEDPEPAPPAPVKDPPPASNEPDLPPWEIEAADDSDQRDDALAAELAGPDAAMLAPWQPPAEPAPRAAPAVAVVAPPKPFRAEGIDIAPTAKGAEAAAPGGASVALACAEDWLELVAASGLSGPSRQLAANAAFISFQHGVLKLGLSPGFEYLSSERALGALSEMLGKALGSPPKIVVDATQAPAETLHQRSDRQRGERQQAAEAFFMADPEVQVLIQQHGARLVSDSIRPFEE